MTGGVYKARERIHLSLIHISCLSDYMVDKEIASGEFVELLADKRLPVEMPFSAVYYSDRAVSTRTVSYTHLDVYKRQD